MFSEVRFKVFFVTFKFYKNADMVLKKLFLFKSSQNSQLNSCAKNNKHAKIFWK